MDSIILINIANGWKIHSFDGIYMHLSGNCGDFPAVRELLVNPGGYLKHARNFA